jgi:LacI family transcriptional regulator
MRTQQRCRRVQWTFQPVAWEICTVIASNISLYPYTISLCAHIRHLLFVPKKTFFYLVNAKAIRIKDIARMAGVSTATVDRVLHKRGQVSGTALQKVMAILNEIDYKPNLLARTLGSNKKFRIVAIIPDPSLDPYWEKINSGIHQAQNEWNQYSVTIEMVHFDQFSERSFRKKALDALKTTPDGILTAPVFYDEALSILELYKKDQIPFVLINNNISETKPLTFIGQDLYRSGQLGAQLMYLSQQQTGKLIVLHLFEDTHNSRHLSEKERGFRAFYKTIKKQNSKGKKVNFEINDFSLTPVEPSFKKKLTDIVKDKDVRGIFVSSSRGTSIVASFLDKHGKNSISLIGYDMLDENLRYLKSGVIDFLINQNPKNQASRGIGHLVNHLLFKKKVPSLDLFPLEIITQLNVDSYLNSEIH